MGEKAVYVERDCGVDCESLNGLDALVKEMPKGGREKENGGFRAHGCVVWRVSQTLMH